MRRSILMLAVTLAWPREGSSQVSTTPTRLVEPFAIDRGYLDLKRLTDLYNAGEWTRLQDLAKSLLDATAAAARSVYPGNKELAAATHSSQHYIIVTWIGIDAFDKPMLARIVVHGGPRKTEPVDPFLADLPGAGDDDHAVYGVFFGRGLRGKIAETYLSTRDKDPISDELPAFIQALAAPLFATYGVLAGPINPPPALRGAQAANQPSIAATVARVALPFERATIKWKAVAKEPVAKEALDNGLSNLSSELRFLDVPHSACAQEFAADAVSRLNLAASSAHCAADTSTAAECKDFIGGELSQAYDQKTCGNPPKPPAKDEKDALLTVDEKVRAFVDRDLTTMVEAELTFKNRPLTHWSFGAGSGVVTRASLTLPRVNVKNGTIAADPLPRVMTFSFVNWSPKGYKAELDRVGGAERVRPFFGATLTPDFGAAAGVNVLLVRGIGVAGGASVMFAKGASKDEIGKAPANPDKPFTISYERVTLFLGVSYTFK